MEKPCWNGIFSRAHLATCHFVFRQACPSIGWRAAIHGAGQIQRQHVRPILLRHQNSAQFGGGLVLQQLQLEVAVWFPRNNLRGCRRRLFPKGSQLAQSNCVHCQATMHQTLSHYPAPNFGKTFCRPITFGQSWTFGRASSLSEIGGRERTPKQGLGSETQSEILRVVSV